MKTMRITKYILFSEDKSNGDLNLRQKILMNNDKSNYICETLDIQPLKDWIVHYGDNTKTYIIRKYIENVVQIRKLGRCYNIYEAKERIYDAGDLTSTWEKYTYNIDKNKWKTTNFRYPDEIVK
jgi:hypothetical protein